jgi:tRNA threonylcarbamoyladenosine biosynthesis protein TsaE
MTLPDSITVTVSSEDAMRELGERLAMHLSCGQVLALSGELGAGKTRLTQGLARGLEIPVDEVTSPTFTLIQEYAGRLPVRHCDAYRLRHSDEFADLGLDELFARDGVAIVEWAERVTDDLPRDRLDIRIEVTGEFERRVVLSARGKSSQRLLDATFPPSH